MIRVLQEFDLTVVMQIWLTTNIRAHDFIPKEYWTDNYKTVKNILPQAEVYVYEDNHTKQINGFIGLTNDYIAGIFIKHTAQSKGIGKQLLDFVKERKPKLSLHVYEKNMRAVKFYQREQFIIQSENIEKVTNEKELKMVWNK
ncbi:MAG: GNAT family N-acetyltransferase [Lachnospiraceae bacterium]|jgi:putative acetyltransferase|nr:GNAT family N-acetyltransferase [Lachnospiraceae bacterium]